MHRFCPTVIAAPVKLALTPTGIDELPIEMKPVMLGVDATYELTVPHTTTVEL
jgi:hypothetical protein